MILPLLFVGLVLPTIILYLHAKIENQARQELKVKIAENSRLIHEHKKQLVTFMRSYRNSVLNLAKKNLEISLKNSPSDESKTNLMVAKYLMKEAIDLSLESSKNTKTSSSECFALVEAIREKCAQISTNRLMFIFSERGFSRKLTSHRDFQIYLTVLGIFKLYIRYSTATAISVNLSGGAVLTISIIDNGNSNKFLTDFLMKGAGLWSLHNRLQMLGGAIERESGAPVNHFIVNIPLELATEARESHEIKISILEGYVPN